MSRFDAAGLVRSALVTTERCFRPRRTQPANRTSRRRRPSVTRARWTLVAGLLAALAYSAGASTTGHAEVPAAQTLLPTPYVPGSTPSSPLTITSAGTGTSNGYPTVPFPSWWNGMCDGWTDLASWNGLYSCGASNGTGYNHSTGQNYGSEGGPMNGEGEWQCVELSKRWLLQAINLPDLSADGYDTATNYWSYIQSHPGNWPERFVTPGTSGMGLLGPGDVVQFGNGFPGHTAVVYATSPSPFNGNGDVNIIQENDGASLTLTVNNWNFGVQELNSTTTMNATGWLHYTGGITGSGPSPAVAYTSAGQQVLFWQGTDDHLWEAWFDGNWHGPVDWTANWNGTVAWPAGADLASAPAVAAPQGQQVVFWQGSNGHLWEAWYAGGWNGPVDWTATWSGTSGWPASANPITAPAVAVVSGQQIVFWEGSNGHLWEAWWSGNWNGPFDLANAWGTSGSVASGPTVAVGNGQQDLFWSGTGGHLWEAWYTSSPSQAGAASGGWNGPVDWTAGWGGTSGWTSANDLTSAPSATVTADGSQQVVFWNAGGHLDEAWYNGVWNGPVDWTASWNGTMPWSASANLSNNAAVTALPGQQAVFWGGVNLHLWEAWWANTNGWNGPVDLSAAWGG